MDNSGPGPGKANQPSTALSREALVGVKCRCMRGCAARKALTSAVLWVLLLSRIRCNRWRLGTALLI